MFVCCLLAGTSVFADAAADADIAVLRTEIESLKADYLTRIGELEARLAAAEEGLRSASTAQPPVVESPQRPEPAASVTAGNAFNPRISLIVDAGYYHDDAGGSGQTLAASALQPSQPVPDEHHSQHADNRNGFSLRETELALSATVDPYFDAGAYLAFRPNGGVEIEEAWFLTRALPAGFKLKGGRFFSDFGYINRQHPHEWDFVDQNLAHLNLLGEHGLRDTGLQLSWLPDLPFYTLVGAELLQGEQERFGAFVGDAEQRSEFGLADRESGPRLWTAFVKVGPELGYDHALQLGASYAQNRQHQELAQFTAEVRGLEGDADLWGLEVVYRYDNPGRYGHRDLKLQAEYLKSGKSLRETAAGADRYDLTTDGYYLQGVYGIAPRWQLGLRYDVLGGANRVRGATRLDMGSSDRWAGVLTWKPSEFSLLRMQYARSDLLTELEEQQTVNAFWLQALLSLGSHGAHRF
jgi:hypothetical protein